MNPSFKDLALFTEQEDFVEYQGALYFVGDDIDFLKAQGFEFEEGELEITDYIASRRNVGCSPVHAMPYGEGFNLDEMDSHWFDQTRVLGKNDEDFVIPDSDYLILRQLKNPPPDNDIPEHVIFRREDEKYYCMANNCNECDVAPVKVPNQYQVVSADIAAQEPMASTLVSREPKWAEVFELKNFRMNPLVLQYLDIIFESHLKISRRDVTYVMWVHDTFFYDQTEIYKLNYLVNSCKVGNELRSSLEEHIKSLIRSYEAYKKEKFPDAE